MSTRAYAISIEGYNHDRTLFVIHTDEPKVAAMITLMEDWTDPDLHREMAPYVTLAEQASVVTATIVYGKGDDDMSYVWGTGDKTRIARARPVTNAEVKRLTSGWLPVDEYYSMGEINEYHYLQRLAREHVNGRRTNADVEALKRSWFNDPHWDIEDTEGFEAHYDELKAYHDECSAEWDRAAAERQRKKDEADATEAEKLGCTLAVYHTLMSLQDENAKLRERIGDLEERICGLDGRRGQWAA